MPVTGPSRVHWKYKVATGLMILLVILFLWLFWMHGEAGWNQVAPRAEFMLKLTHYP